MKRMAQAIWKSQYQSFWYSNKGMNLGVIRHDDGLQYRKTPSISRTKFHNLNLSSIFLPLSSLNPLKPGVKLRKPGVKFLL